MADDKLTLDQKKWVMTNVIDDVSTFFKVDNGDFFGRCFKRDFPDATDTQAKLAFDAYNHVLKDVKDGNDKTFYDFYKKFPRLQWPEKFVQECKDKFDKNYWVIKACDDNGFVKYHAFNKDEFPDVSDARKYFDKEYKDEDYQCYYDCSKEEMRRYASKSW